MMRFLLSLKCFFVALFIGNSGLASPGDLPTLHLGPEKTFQFLYQKIETVLAICLSEEDCKLSDEEKILVEAIVKNLPQESPYLNFESGKKNPNLFFTDGNIRIAVTGSTVGSPIFINTDLAFPKDKFDRKYSLGVDRILAILIHELGHHFGWTQHGRLDQLGLKIGNYFLNHFQMVPIAGENNQDPELRPLELYLGVVQLPFSSKFPLVLKEPSSSLLWIFDEVQIYDVTNSVSQQLICSPSKDVQKPTEVRTFNWEAVGWNFGGSQDFRMCPSSSSAPEESYRIDFFRLQADLNMQCEEFIPDLKVSINFRFHRQCNNQSSSNFFVRPYVFEDFQRLKVSQ